MVSSTYGASKDSKSVREERQLGGIIYTKNLKLSQKIPEKMRAGRMILLLMDMVEEFQDGDAAEICDAEFERVLEMTSLEMPRDFLASLTEYFFRNKEESSSFSRMHTKRPLKLLLH